MKKIVAIACFLVLGATSYAQISDAFRLGLSANPFISFLGSNDPTISPSGANLGFALNMDGEIYFGSSSINDKNYAVTTGLGIVFNSGGKLTHTKGGQLWTSTSLQPPLTDDQGNILDIPDGAKLGYKVQYIRVPLGIKMRTNEVGYLRYFGQVPFLIDIKTQARGTVESTSINTDNKQTINGDVKPVNVSWGIGGGVEYEISTGTSLTGGLFFHGGILDMTRNNGTQTSTNPDPDPENSKTAINTITLKIGVLF